LRNFSSFTLTDTAMAGQIGSWSNKATFTRNSQIQAVAEHKSGGRMVARLMGSPMGRP
jgi:hypothetical protein